MSIKYTIKINSLNNIIGIGVIFMHKKCPVCDEILQSIGKKLVCPSENCQFQCLAAAYDFEIKPWNIQICEDEKFWYYDTFNNYPLIIAREYKRLYELLRDNKLYGVLFQIKDLFEVLIKFPTLLVISKYCDSKKRGKIENQIISFLLENKLSLGHWETIASKCLLLKDNSSVLKILADIVDVYNKNKITHWRNATIGHGALQFDETEEFKIDIENMLVIIKEHLARCSKDYSNLHFSFKKGKKSTELKGADDFTKVLNPQGKLYFFYEGERVELTNFIKIHQNGIYFFDSYNKWDSRTKLLNYVDAKTFSQKMKYFEELFKSISKDLGMDISASSLLSDDIYMASEEKLLNSIDTPEQVSVPSYLKGWLEDCLNKNSKGIYLLQMEGGMGKTTFTRLLDPHSKQKIKFPGVTVRAYYINDAYSFKIDTFKNNVIETLQFDDYKQDYIKGSIQRFTNADNKKEFADILNYFRKVYQNKFGSDTLMFILDGLDEIPVNEEKTIFDYIPDSNYLDKGVHILLTSRTTPEMSSYIAEKVGNVKTNVELVVKSDNKKYLSTMENFIQKYYDIQNPELIDRIVKLAENKFLYIRPIQIILKFKGEDILKQDFHIYGEFLSIMKDLYSEKYFKKIQRLLLALAAVRQPLTINEISYMVDGQEPNFKLLAYLADISALLRKERTYRGNTIGLSHMDLRNYLLETFKDELSQMCSQWIDDVLDIDYSTDYIEQGRLNLLFNSLHLSKYCDEKYKLKLINNKNFDISTIYKFLENIKMKQHHISSVIQFINDFIAELETVGDEMDRANLIKLIEAYVIRTQIYLENGFGGKILYENYLDKALELIEDYNIKDDNLLMMVYSMREEYYRKTGNVRKSLEDNEKLGEILSKKNVKKIESADYHVFIKASALLRKAINYKNLDKINEALELSNSAKSLIDGHESFYKDVILSNILNNIGLCQLKLNNLDEAQKHIEEAINLVNDIKAQNEMIDYFYYYSNLGQVFRKKGKLDEALKVYTEAIDALITKSSLGWSVDNNVLSLLYNGRANIYRDMGNEKNSEQFQKLALEDYLAAEKLIKEISSDSQNIPFVATLYINIAAIYKNILQDEKSAEEYFAKYEAIRKEKYKNQLFPEELEQDVSLEEKMLLVEAGNYFNKADNFIKKHKYKKAMELYDKAINTLELSTQTEVTEYVLPMLYYNKANCAHALFTEKLLKNYELKRRGISISEDYSEFNPAAIISVFLKAEKGILLNKEEKSVIYRSISHIYLEALKDYENAALFAKKIFEVGIAPHDGYHMLGNIHFELEEFEEAIANYEQAIKTSPSEFPEAIQNLEAAKMALKQKQSGDDTTIIKSPEDLLDTDLALKEFARLHMEGEDISSSEKIFSTLQKKAQEGHSASQVNLGLCYLEGKFVEKDSKKAIEWFELSAKQNNPIALFNLGQCYAEGIGQQKNMKKAIKYWEKAAKLEHGVAQYNLGVQYFEGRYVRKNLKKAVNWFQKALDNGYIDAAKYIVNIHVDTNGKRVSSKLYIKALKILSEKGESIAKLKLAFAYLAGDGVNKDINAAKILFEELAATGDEYSKQMLQLIKYL